MFYELGIIDRPDDFLFCPKIRLFPPKVQNKIIFYNLTFVKYFFGFSREI